MTSFRNETHVHPTHQPHNHHHATPPSRLRSHNLSALITKFETLDLKGKSFSQPEMQPVPLHLPNRGEHTRTAGHRFVPGKLDMDLNMEMHLRSLDRRELERLAEELDIAEKNVCSKRERALKHLSTETMPGGKALLRVDGRTGQRISDENARSGYRTFRPGNTQHSDKSSVLADPFLSAPIQGNVQAIPDKNGPVKIAGIRRESKILDRIRMFDGSMEPSKIPVAIKGPLGVLSSTGTKQRVISAERKPVLYSPSSVRNSYVRSSPRSATKTPMRSGGMRDHMWTPASKDSRSRKKELYTHQSLSPSRGRTRENAQSSTITAGTPLRSHLQRQAPASAGELLNAHYRDAQPWTDKARSNSPLLSQRYQREVYLKTPTPIGNARMSKLAKTRMEIKDMLGKAIEARVSSIKGLDQTQLTLLKENGAVDDKINGQISPSQKKKNSPVSSASSKNEEESNEESLLTKELEAALLTSEKGADTATPPPVECCEFGSSPSRKVSKNLEVPVELQVIDKQPKTTGIDSSRQVSKGTLADKIALFEKLFSNTAEKKRISTMPVAMPIGEIQGKSLRSGTFAGSTKEFYSSTDVNVGEKPQPWKSASVFLHQRKPKDPSAPQTASLTAENYDQDIAATVASVYDYTRRSTIQPQTDITSAQRHSDNRPPLNSVLHKVERESKALQSSPHRSHSVAKSPRTRLCTLLSQSVAKADKAMADEEDEGYLVNTTDQRYPIEIKKSSPNEFSKHKVIIARLKELTEERRKAELVKSKTGKVARLIQKFGDFTRVTQNTTGNKKSIATRNNADGANDDKIIDARIKSTFVLERRLQVYAFICAIWPEILTLRNEVEVSQAVFLIKGYDKWLSINFHEYRSTHKIEEDEPQIHLGQAPHIEGDLAKKNWGSKERLEAQVSRVIDGISEIRPSQNQHIERFVLVLSTYGDEAKDYKANWRVLDVCKELDIRYDHVLEKDAFRLIPGLLQASWRRYEWYKTTLAKVASAWHSRGGPDKNLDDDMAHFEDILKFLHPIQMGKDSAGKENAKLWDIVDWLDFGLPPLVQAKARFDKRCEAKKLGKLITTSPPGSSRQLKSSSKEIPKLNQKIMVGGIGGNFWPSPRVQDQGLEEENDMNQGAGGEVNDSSPGLKKYYYQIMWEYAMEFDRHWNSCYVIENQDVVKWVQWKKDGGVIDHGMYHSDNDNFPDQDDGENAPEHSGNEEAGKYEEPQAHGNDCQDSYVTGHGEQQYASGGNKHSVVESQNRNDPNTAKKTGYLPVPTEGKIKQRRSCDSDMYAMGGLKYRSPFDCAPDPRRDYDDLDQQERAFKRRRAEESGGDPDAAEREHWLSVQNWHTRIYEDRERKFQAKEEEAKKALEASRARVKKMLEAQEAQAKEALETRKGKMATEESEPPLYEGRRLASDQLKSPQPKSATVEERMKKICNLS